MSDTFDHEGDAMDDVLFGATAAGDLELLHSSAKRAGEPWSTSEENSLRKLFNDRAPIEAMMARHGRTRVGIEKRLEQMGLSIHYRNMTRAIVPRKHYEGSLVKKESNYVNMQHLITLLQKGYTTLEVAFTRGPADERQSYTYKVADKVRATLKPDDYVVVENAQRGMLIAKIKEIHESPQIDVKSPFALKWIVCKVDREAYDDQVKREAEAIKMIEVAERKTAQEKALNEILGHTDRETLLALINGTQPEVTATKGD